MTEENKEICFVCKQESEDLRTLKIDCFYDLKEAIPEMETQQYFTEIEKEGSYWGYTRRYPKGTRDEFDVIEKTENCSEIKTKQVPIDDIRLIEQSFYSLRVCKNCRAAFINTLKNFADGLFQFDRGEGDIPIRENGAIKFITRRQWDERTKKNESRPKN